MREIVSSEPNSVKDYYKAIRLVSLMAVGGILAVFIGMKLDAYFHTAPWILLGLLAYAIGGSLYLIVKELGDVDGRS